MDTGREREGVGWENRKGMEKKVREWEKTGRRNGDLEEDREGNNKMGRCRRRERGWKRNGRR